jgi:hypothetical protein
VRDRSVSRENFILLKEDQTPTDDGAWRQEFALD